MESIKGPLLTGVLVWLLALSTGAFHGQHHYPDCHSGPGEHERGHRPIIPGKKGISFPREEDEVNPSRLVNVQSIETAIPESVSSCLDSHQSMSLARLGFPGHPLYLTLQALLI
jgi:hypothetical protein